MNQIKNRIDELKQIQQFPRYHLAKYFDELKSKVDLKYALNFKEQDKYSEIIKTIESFEQDSYNKWKSKSINTYDNEIKSIEDNLNNNFNLTDIARLIDGVKFKIEKIIFSNKSVLFIDDIKNIVKDSSNSDSFLLIINDEFISKSYIDHDSEDQIFKRENLIEFFLKFKLEATRTDDKRIVTFDINIQQFEYYYNKEYKEIDQNLFNELCNLKYIYFNSWQSDNKIERIHRNQFESLVNLVSISFKNNIIKELDPNLFNGLPSLKIIDFDNNKIEELHPNLFDGLSNLKSISFKCNQIKKIHKDLLNGLCNLKTLSFSHNQIIVINPYIFNGLSNLECISFEDNEIRKLHPRTFNRLANLENLYFARNNIKVINKNIFSGLSNLTVINFRGNGIEKIHPNLLNGLINLKYFDIGQNQIKKIHPNLLNGLINLISIDFEQNQIKIIHPNLFNCLINLNYIDFGQNQIKKICPNFFKQSTNLKSVNFSSNKIEKIDKNLFAALANIGYINFNNNQEKEKQQYSYYTGLDNIYYRKIIVLFDYPQILIR
jgi:Leucine-rich repeat (LRR) protein